MNRTVSVFLQVSLPALPLSVPQGRVRWYRSTMMADPQGISSVRPVPAGYGPGRRRGNVGMVSITRHPGASLSDPAGGQ